MLAKVPAEAQAEVKAAYWAIFDTGAPPPVASRPGTSSSPRSRPARRLRPTYGKFSRRGQGLLTDREQLTSYLRFPVEHHKRLRHANFIERTFGETRRRVKVIGRLPGEPPASTWSGPCWTGPAGAGAASTPPTPGSACCTTCAGSYSTHQPDPPNHHPPSQKLSRRRLTSPTRSRARHLHRSWDATLPSGS